MSKLFSFSRTQTIIILTMSFVLILSAVYIFVYIPNHKRRVEELRFRCLQSVQTNIKAKRDNSVALLKNLLVTYMLDKDDYKRDLLRDYIASYAMENFTLMQPKPINEVLKIDGVNEKTTIQQLEEIDASHPDSVVIELNNDHLNISLYKGKYSIGMKYTLSQFFGTLLPPDTYDQYLVMLDSAIVYQTFESGIKIGRAHV